MLSGAAENQKIGLCSGYGQWHSPNNKRDPREYVTISMSGIVGMMKTPPTVEKSKAQWGDLLNLVKPGTRGTARKRHLSCFMG